MNVNEAIANADSRSMSGDRNADRLPMQTSNKVRDSAYAAGLDECSRDELLQRIHRMSVHIEQLRNVIKNSTRPADCGDDAPSPRPPKRKQNHERRPFSFDNVRFRHVALQITYLGWNYDGFVVQEDTARTVEARLFEALLKTKLIRSRDTSHYHRCGRTDKGVSAFRQVITIDLRSRLPGDGTVDCGDDDDSQSELPYCRILNKVLPEDVRVLAWAPVASDFSARFDCVSREYRYYFAVDALDIAQMRAAGLRLVGEHDFRNFCKADTGHVETFVRQIISVQIDQPDAAQLAVLRIVASSFLWHQIRCVVAVLFLVGQGKEQPTVVDLLLDITAHPKRPQYLMASELPLVLFDCAYEQTLRWRHDNSVNDVFACLSHQWIAFQTRADMLADCLRGLSHLLPAAPRGLFTSWVCKEGSARNYQPLLKRKTCHGSQKQLATLPIKKLRIDLLPQVEQSADIQ